MKDNFWSSLKSFFIGRKCSLCGKTMQRIIDGFQTSHVVMLNKCTCGVYISENNYKWAAMGYDLSEDCFLHVSVKTPNIGEVYGPFDGSVSPVLFDLPLDHLDISKQDLEQINKKIRHFMLLS